MSKKRTIIITTTLMITLFYIVFFIHTYLPFNYYLQYNLHDTYKVVDKDIVLYATHNLIGYFFHTQSLDSELFSKRELIHYQEVRVIYDSFFILTIICLIALLYSKPSKKEIYKSLKTLRILTLIPLMILPIFSLFWNKIFHIILFSNSYWITFPNEISYYLFPTSFFSITLLSMILILQIIINIPFYKLKNSKFIKN